MTIVLTRVLIDIVTKIPIERVKVLFQPVTTKLFPTAKVHAILSLIYVPRKNSPVTTDHIIPRVDIFVLEFRVFLFCESDRYNNLEVC